MPKAMERALKKEAHKKGLTGEALNRYVYGTIAKNHLMPSQQKKGKK